MSAAGRLWRRAPLWRFCILAGVATTALAAMFPPPVPHWLQPKPLAAAPGATPAPAEADKLPSFLPEATSGPAEYGMIGSPAPGPGRSGIIPFSGRQLPLPGGSWQLLVLARGSAPTSVQLELLARIEAQRLTGLMVAASPGPLNDAAGSVGNLHSCDEQDAIAHQGDTGGPGQNPLVHECWTLSRLDIGASSPIRTDEIMKRGFARLAQMNVDVPGRMLELRYLRSDETGWMTDLLLLPDHAAEHRLQAWARRYAADLHRGFDGRLGAADQGSLRDPE